jgi:uncharacterized protein YjbJ (UPF0337 family)
MWYFNPCMVRSDHFPVCAFGNIVLGCLCSDPIIGLRYAACAKETIHEGGRETRVGFCSDVALLRQVLAKVVSIFYAQKKAAFAATRRRTVNEDQIFGKIQQAVGKVKQGVGETLGNEKLANQGVVDQLKGAAKETWGNAKDASKEAHQSHQKVATDKAHERRNKISRSVQNAKEKANEKIDELKERHSA